MQVDERCPFCIVFLVDGNVIAIAFEDAFGRSVDLNPGVACHNIVFAKLWLVHHDTQLVVQGAAACWNFNEQIMVAVTYIGNFDIVSAEFLRDFFTIVDAVLDESAAFDFPAVVDAATGGEACCNSCNPDESCCESC